MDCAMCQSPLPADAAYCTACGAAVPKANTGPTDRGAAVPKANTGPTDRGAAVPKANTGPTVRLAGDAADIAPALNTLPENLLGKIDTELAPAERIYWIEQPPARFFTPSSTYRFLFGMVWTILSLSMAYLTLMRGGTHASSRGIRPIIDFLVLLLVFVPAGLLVLSSSFMEWREALQTVYLITDKRAIIIKGEKSVLSFTPDQLNNVYRRKNSDGTGDVIITTQTRFYRRGTPYDVEIGFLSIRNAQEAERRLKELAQGLSPLEVSPFQIARQAGFAREWQDAVELTGRGITAYNQGDLRLSADLFQQATEIAPEYEMAWLWRATAAVTDDEKRAYLEEALRVNPASKLARRGLARIGAVNVATLPKPAAPDETPAYISINSQRPS